MKYTGRIRMSLIYLSVCAIILIGRYIAGNMDTPPYDSIIGVLLFLPLMWWVGKQYDELEEEKIQLKQDKEDFEKIFDNSHSYMWIIDEVIQKMTVSKGIEEIFGYTDKEFENDYNLWISRTYPEDIERVRHHYQILLSGRPSNLEWRIIRRNGEIRWLEIFGTPVFNEIGRVVKLTGVAYDITERKEMEEQIRRAAFYDALTELPNRAGFKTQLEEALIRAERNYEEAAVLFMDLDRFKLVNDTMGHTMGDRLLIEVSKRLKASVDPEAIIARQGGDEFMILIENTSEEKVIAVTERILDSFKNQFDLEGEEFYISPSIGISLYPKGGQDAESLIQHANTAMHAAKNDGKNSFHFYAHENEFIFNRKMIIERGLKTSLKKKELHFYYQPNVELQTGEVYGVEAKLRWQHPELGLVSADEFIPIAEDTGMILPIGDWAIHEVCKQNKMWQEAGVHTKIVMHISILQFEDPFFIDKVKHALSENQMAAEYLVLEITERVIQNISNSMDIIQELKSLGVKVSIDGFGAGYSSIRVLNNALIDLVKIDKSFINELTANSMTATLVKMLIQIGKTMNFALIADGVEEEDQVRFLARNGCQFGQGAFYSQPLPANRIEELLKNKSGATSTK